MTLRARTLAGFHHKLSLTGLLRKRSTFPRIGGTINLLVRLIFLSFQLCGQLPMEPGGVWDE
jgi:hypothetical protein